jgi:hypothetical protein
MIGRFLGARRDERSTISASHQLPLRNGGLAAEVNNRLRKCLLEDRENLLVRKVSDGPFGALESSRAIVAEILLQEIREVRK